jgi:hypothetical protein
MICCSNSVQQGFDSKNPEGKGNSLKGNREKGTSNSPQKPLFPLNPSNNPDNKPTSHEDTIERVDS